MTGRGGALGAPAEENGSEGRGWAVQSTADELGGTGEEERGVN